MTAQTETDFHLGHRNRLRQKCLDEKLAHYELFELLLSYAIPRRDVRPLARGLIAHFGSVHQVLAASPEDLQAYKGVGYNTAVFAKALHQLTLLTCLTTLKEYKAYPKDENIREYCRRLAAGKQVEEFHVLYFDHDRRLVEEEMHVRGTIDFADIYIREIVRKAMNLPAKEVVVMHNHPISQQSFSTPDIQATKELEEMLRAVKISLYDHFLVSGGIVYSIRELNLLK